MKTFTTTHPKNNQDVILSFDEDLNITSATYSDGEAVDMTDSVKSHFNQDLFLFIN